MTLAQLRARGLTCALALAFVALATPAHAADAVTWGAVIEPLLPYAGAILSAVFGWLAVRLIGWLNLSGQQAMAQAVTAAASRAAGLAYQVLVAQAGRVGGAEIRQQAVARGVGYLSATVPDFIGRLGLTPQRLQLMVEGELGKLLAADPSVAVPAGVAGAAPANQVAAVNDRAPLRMVAAIVPLLLAGGLLAACADGRPTPAGAAAISAGVTLAGVAAAQNQDVAAVVAGGQLFCQAGGAVIALLDATGKPSSVIGKAGPVVAEACKAISAVAVPVSPPPNPGAVPAVVPAVPVL